MKTWLQEGIEHGAKVFVQSFIDVLRMSLETRNRNRSVLAWIGVSLLSVLTLPIAIMSFIFYLCGSLLTLPFKGGVCKLYPKPIWYNFLTTWSKWMGDDLATAYYGCKYGEAIINITGASLTDFNSMSNDDTGSKQASYGQSSEYTVDELIKEPVDAVGLVEKVIDEHNMELNDRDDTLGRDSG